ncbi:RWD-domain-containing protein [Lojkania enalia]|uniref:RBR-type E3 ubiquitin transferase n=1 Tax=Lojkania enalia TaxID=147567 RepID=A0A9P4N5W7_9PLEO|nr:RWD-domain-containing protein [Didymosphaeria enalia]
MTEFITEDEREEELTTLESIYPELVRDHRYPFAAHIDLDVTPTKQLPVVFNPERTIRLLSHLPPLHIDIILQNGYPAVRPPHVKLSSVWLSADVVFNYEKEVISQWEEYGGMQILFSYISLLQEAAEDAFGLSRASAKEPISLPLELKDALLEFNTKKGRENFNQETFDCGVCLEPKKGSACYRMKRCGHVFCIACLQDFYNNCIKEGDVNNVKCMSPECGKAGDGASDRRRKQRLISPKELLQIPLALQTVRRYAELRRKKKIEADKSIAFCPRKWCQAPMKSAKYPKLGDVSQMGDDDSDYGSQEDLSQAPSTEMAEDAVQPKKPKGASGTDRLAICEACNLAFCKVCLTSWHGDLVWCVNREPSEITEEEQASLNFILQNTTPCPTCSVPCQKAHGCNHMTCFQCKTHFCYLCSAWLEPDDPYKHFNSPKNKACHQRLMDLTMGDMGDGVVRFGRRRGAEQVAAFWEREALRIQMGELGE